MSATQVAPPGARRPPSPSRSPRRARRVAAVTARAVRDQARAVVLWGVALAALGAFLAAIYPSIQNMIADVAARYPSGLKEAFGVGDMATVEGYVHAELFSLIVPLAIGVFAIRSATRATIGAEERDELDTVLALPLPRIDLVLGSFLAAGVSAAAILLQAGLGIWVGGRVAGTGISAGLTAAGTLGLWPFALFAAGVGVLAGGVSGHWSSVSAGAGGVLVAMYALDLAARLAHPVAGLRFVSAFHYYGAPLRDGVDVSSSAVLTVAALLFAGAGALLFERRDIGR